MGMRGLIVIYPNKNAFLAGPKTCCWCCEFFQPDAHILHAKFLQCSPGLVPHHQVCVVGFKVNEAAHKLEWSGWSSIAWLFLKLDLCRSQDKKSSSMSRRSSNSGHSVNVKQPSVWAGTERWTAVGVSSNYNTYM